MKQNPSVFIYLIMDHSNVVYRTVFVRTDSLCKNIVMSHVPFPPLPCNTKDIMQNLNITNNQESPYISETKYQLQRHTSSPYMWLCLAPSYNKRLPQNIPQQKHISRIFCIIYQAFLKIQYILFSFSEYILQTECQYKL